MSAHKSYKYARKHIANPPETPWLDWIISGDKIYEGRLNRGYWAQLEVGDSLYLTDNRKLVFVQVTDKHFFSDFADAYSHLGQSLVPIPKLTGQTVNKLYAQYFTDLDVDQFGVVALGLKVINTVIDHRGRQTDILHTI